MYPTALVERSSSERTEVFILGDIQIARGQSVAPADASAAGYEEWIDLRSAADVVRAAALREGAGALPANRLKAHHRELARPGEIIAAAGAALFAQHQY